MLTDGVITQKVCSWAVGNTFNSHMSFGHRAAPLTVDFINQPEAFEQGYTRMVAPISHGLTDNGVLYINESIRTLVWAILGAQAQMRTPILGPQGLGAQKQLIRNVEDAINAPIDSPSSVARYQDTLRYASTPINFVLGEDLYIIPSDMLLRMDTTNAYNNELQVNGTGLHMGQHNINTTTNVTLDVTPDVQYDELPSEPDLEETIPPAENSTNTKNMTVFIAIAATLMWWVVR